MTDELYYRSATELAAMLRAKQVSAREVVTAHLERIEALNPRINAIVTLTAERALRPGGRAGPARRPERVRRSAARTSGGPQGQSPHRRHPDHLRLPDPRRVRAGHRRPGHRADEAGRA